MGVSGIFQVLACDAQMQDGLCAHSQIGRIQTQLGDKCGLQLRRFLQTLFR